MHKDQTATFYELDGPENGTIDKAFSWLNCFCYSMFSRDIGGPVLLGDGGITFFFLEGTHLFVQRAIYNSMIFNVVSLQIHFFNKTR